MKKLGIFFLILIINISSCFHSGKKRTVEVNNNGNHLKIQYYGKIAFNDDETELVNLTPNGFVKYKKNNRAITIYSDETGSIHYKIFENSEKINPYSELGESIIENAIEEIAYHYQ